MRRTGFKPRTSGLPRGNGNVTALPRKDARAGHLSPVAGPGTFGGTGGDAGTRRRSGATAGIPGNAARQSPQRKAASQDPGFHPAVKAAILRRDGGCFLRGGAYGPCWGPVVAHHRRLSGQGGSTAPESHKASNGISLCNGGHHNGWVHRFRLKAAALGLIVSRWSDPAAMPVRKHEGGEEIWLTDDGNYADHPPESRDGGEVA